MVNKLLLFNILIFVEIDARELIVVDTRIQTIVKI